MNKSGDRAKPASAAIPKCATGIAGFDRITGGGLPRGRATLVVGGPGCGKTLFSAEFLAHGAEEYGESGVFVTFEETGEELLRNTTSVGQDLAGLCRRKKILVDYVKVERDEIEETGEYDLDGLFVRLAHAIDSIGAKRVVLDTVESLFAGLSNEGILRSELRRLFRWLKDRGVTTVVTAERGTESITRHGLEEYVADCVLLLDHRVTDQISTRRLRVIKYRGSGHGMNEYPFLISDRGMYLIPITAAKLDYRVTRKRISSGNPRLDALLGGGFYRGTTILVSGAPGTGKTSVAATFAEAACGRREATLFAAFEESASQLYRNMLSIGIDLQPWSEKGILHVRSERPVFTGLEEHILLLTRKAEAIGAKVLVIDPISSLFAAGTRADVEGMLTRVIDHFKSRGITALCTSLSPAESEGALRRMGVSSLMDTWITLDETADGDGERLRRLSIVKSRGTAHSTRVHEFRLTRQGIEIPDAREERKRRKEENPS